MTHAIGTSIIANMTATLPPLRRKNSLNPDFFTYRLHDALSKKTLGAPSTLRRRIEVQVLRKTCEWLENLLEIERSAQPDG